MGENKMATTKKSVKKTVKKTNVKKCACKCGCGNGDCACGGRAVTCKCAHGANDSVKYTSMFGAYRAFWRRGFTEWRGTSSRSEYWWAWLGNILACVLFVVLGVGAVVIDAAIFKEDAIFTTITLALGGLYVISAIIPSISMLTRRMHDAGLSAWFWLLYLTTFVPLVGSYIWTIAIFVIALLPTRTVDNPYHKYNK